MFIVHFASCIVHDMVLTMGTLSTELAPHVERLANPRVYADANVPAGIVTFMRERLQWDVLAVIEHDDLRRARRHAPLRPRAPAASHARHDRSRLPGRPPLSACTQPRRAGRLGPERAPARAHAAACRRRAVPANVVRTRRPHCRSKGESSSSIPPGRETSRSTARRVYTDDPVGLSPWGWASGLHAPHAAGSQALPHMSGALTPAMNRGIKRRDA